MQRWGSVNRISGQIRDDFRDRILIDAEIVSVKDTAPSVSIVSVRYNLQSAEPLQVVSRTEDVRLIYEGTHEPISFPKIHQGTWKIFTYYPLL
jgi:hypothetical protein